MRFIYFLFLLSPLVLLATSGVTTIPPGDAVVDRAVQAPTVTQIKDRTVIVHNLNYSIVSGANLGAGQKKIEVVYTDGLTEHHIFLAGQAEVKQFNKRPLVYIAKITEAEKHAK